MAPPKQSRLVVIGVVCLGSLCTPHSTLSGLLQDPNRKQRPACLLSGCLEPWGWAPRLGPEAGP